MPASVALVRLEPPEFAALAGIEVTDEQKRFLDTPALIEFLAGAHLHPAFSNHAVVVAGPAGAVVGYLSLGFLPEEPASWWIPLLLIDYRHQRRGFGRDALRLAIELCRAEPSCARLGLSYRPENVIAARLYERLGFVPTGGLDEKGEQVAWFPVGNTGS